jgi:hypothetical protein
MTRSKKILSMVAVVLAMGVTSISVFAASGYSTPAEALAGLTGKTVQEVIQQRQETGKSYGVIADEAGKLEEFKEETLQIKKDILDKRVAAGTLTQAEADEILKAIEANQAICDGTGSAKIGQKYGAGFGNGNGMRNGNGFGNGMRNGNGQGLGRGMGGCLQNSVVTQ